MRTSREVQRELDRLLREYESEVESARTEGLITRTTAATYILHADHFVRWVKGEFEPGSRKRYQRDALHRGVLL